MSDDALTTALQSALDLEGQARDTFDRAGDDLAEKDAAQDALRHATALRKSIERWIGRRALRAQLVRRS